MINPSCIKELDCIVSNFRNEVKLLAQRVRKEVLIPFCKTYNMTFSINDGYRFYWHYKNDNDWIDLDFDFYHNWTLPEHIKKEIGPIVDLLCTEVYRCEYLADIVDNVCWEDLEDDNQK